MVKIFWTFLIIFGIGVIVANMGYVIDKYLKFPVEVSLTFEEPFQWPELTFCYPTLPFVIKENTSKHIYWNEIMDKVSNELMEDDVFNYWEYKMMVTMATIDRSRLGLDFRDYFLKSHLSKYNDVSEARHLIIPPKLWTIRNRIKYTTYYDVPCYSFKLRNTSLDAHRDIKSVLLNLKLDHDSKNIFYKGDSPRSLFLFINNEDEMLQGDHYTLTPGYQYTFDISQSRYIRKGSHRSCRTERFTTDIYDYTMTHSSSYEGDYIDCVRFVRQKHILKHCKCYWHKFPIHKIGREFPKICFNISSFTRDEFWQNNKCFKNVISHLSDECDQYKRIKCDSKSYKVSHQKVDLFEKSLFMTESKRDDFAKRYGHQFPEYVNRTDLIEIIKDSWLRVIIKRENEFGELRKEEYSYIFSQLLSDIGGLMGVCLGISFVGLFEMAVLLCHYVSRKGSVK